MSNSFPNPLHSALKIFLKSTDIFSSPPPEPSSKLSSCVTWTAEQSLGWSTHIYFSSTQLVIQLQPRWYIQNVDLFTSSPYLNYHDSISWLWGKTKASVLPTRYVLTPTYLLSNILHNTHFSPCTNCIVFLFFIFTVLLPAIQSLCIYQFPYKDIFTFLPSFPS